MEEKKPTLSESLKELAALFEEASIKYQQQADQYWNNLSQEDKLLAFYSVCKRIHKADVVDKGSYRYSLYEVFGFGMESYTIGMDCGYIEIHNLIHQACNQKDI